jgi:hypothetical protein
MRMSHWMQRLAGRRLLFAPHRWAALFLMVMLGALAACATATPEWGILEGRVTIGPLMPVSQPGAPDPTPAPEVYAEREIVVYGRDGRDEVARVQIGADGTYSVRLAPGTYVVDINHVGIDQAAGLPKMVDIHSGEITRLDIDIDTGIR